MPDVQTAPPAQGTPTVKLTAEQVTAWRARLKAGTDVIRPIITQGRKNVERYSGKSLAMAPTTDTVVVPLDFVYLEQKKSALFFQTPEIRAEGELPQYEVAAPTFAAVMNQALGPKGVDAKTTVWEMLTDVLGPTGYAVSKIGYYPTVDGMKQVRIGEQPVPVEQPGSVLGLNPPTVMQPVYEQVANVIAQRYAWDRFPPGWFCAPKDFRGSDFDKAAWLSMRFEEDLPDGEDTRSRGYGQNEDAKGLLLSDPPDGQTGQPKTPKKCGVEVWYKASLFDTDAKHPELVRTFKLYDGDDTEPERRESPFQRIGPDGTITGMIGFPIHVLTLRYLPDAAFPPSDCTMSRQTVDEISKGRTQMIQRRDRSLPQVGYDATRVLKESLDKIQRNENTSFVGFNGPIDDSTMKAIDKGTFGRENFEFNNIGQRDLDMIWTLGAAAGVLNQAGSETATKSNQIQSAIDTRLEAERTRVLEFYVKGVTKLAALYQLFATDKDYVRLAGPQGAQLVAWNKDTIAGRYAFSAKPNSHVRIDAAAAAQQALNNYNQMRKDPSCNAEYLIKDVAEKLGLDPSRLYVKPEPPQPEKPNVSYAVKVEDFAGPAARVAAILAKSAGVEIPAADLAMIGTLGALYAAQQAEQEAAQQAQKLGQSTHGGAAQQTEPINKHNQQVTGGTPGIGVM